ncbi:hypothetical protein [Psittacicella hinzii]|uniref:DUF4407 domain-containing protein n=1 Tax=Psittacicella hinzii TaxID=2028575 RepID=A0A3A1YK63_9GAMM|nr:hypothetical protein [Psittacicella hinzii]RIY37430.1 hypothetical protein CKF58_05070 [Psittacicella hinzii]
MVLDNVKKVEKVTVPGWIHIALIILLGISFYETFIGYSELMGKFPALGFSLAVTLILFAGTITIGKAVVNRESVVAPFLFTIVFALVTYAGNFNAFFTQFNTEIIYRKELTLHKDELKDVLESAKKVVAVKSADDLKLQSDVKELVSQLEIQVTDPSRPGFGKRATELLAEISKVLGKPLTELSHKDAPQALRLYKEQIDKILNERLKNSELGKAQILLNNVTAAANAQSVKIDKVLQGGRGEIIRTHGYSVIQESVDTVNALRTEVAKYADDEELYKFEPTKFGAEEIGKITYAFSEGWGNYKFISIFITILCLIIDLAAPLYLIFVVGDRVKKLAEKNNTSNRRRAASSSLD